MARNTDSIPDDLSESDLNLTQDDLKLLDTELEIDLADDVDDESVFIEKGESWGDFDIIDEKSSKSKKEVYKKTTKPGGKTPDKQESSSQRSDNPSWSPPSTHFRKPTDTFGTSYGMDHRPSSPSKKKQAGKFSLAAMFSQSPVRNIRFMLILVLGLTTISVFYLFSRKRGPPQGVVQLTFDHNYPGDGIVNRIWDMSNPEAAAAARAQQEYEAEQARMTQPPMEQPQDMGMFQQNQFGMQQQPQAAQQQFGAYQQQQQQQVQPFNLGQPDAAQQFQQQPQQVDLQQPYAQQPQVPQQQDQPSFGQAGNMYVQQAAQEVPAQQSQLAGAAALQEQYAGLAAAQPAQQQFGGYGQAAQPAAADTGYGAIAGQAAQAGYGQADQAAGYGQAGQAAVAGGYGQQAAQVAAGGYGQAAPAGGGYGQAQDTGYGQAAAQAGGYGQAAAQPAAGGYGQAAAQQAQAGYGQAAQGQAVAGYAQAGAAAAGGYNAGQQQQAMQGGYNAQGQGYQQAAGQAQAGGYNANVGQIVGGNPAQQNFAF